MNTFDVIIIGFGKGGKTLAAEFAKRGGIMPFLYPIRLSRLKVCILAYLSTMD